MGKQLSTIFMRGIEGGTLPLENSFTQKMGISDDVDFVKEHYADCFQALEIESRDPMKTLTLESKSDVKVRVELSRECYRVLDSIRGPDLSGQRFENIEQLLSQIDDYPALLVNLVAKRLESGM